jgi:hypothetical protein
MRKLSIATPHALIPQIVKSPYTWLKGIRCVLCKGEHVNVPHCGEFLFQQESNPSMGT